ncbi:hypothetical protein F7725_012400 [Dissostichus mawsoni]|uniref:Uncharacterized protein n=1 Tax=Dissostichus mawsoni TaxID=36200 RepID=A0A7J5YQR8_DISMA|nr:hypothetical protein F7725_012400 [Dissostichus mawsoni]
MGSVHKMASINFRRSTERSYTVLFAWNNYELPTPRRNVWERRPRAESPTPDLTAEYEVETVALPDHEYCLNPATAVMANQVADENEALKSQIRELQHQLEVLQLQSRFGIQRLAGSDEDIRFYTSLLFLLLRLFLSLLFLPALGQRAAGGGQQSSTNQICCPAVHHSQISDRLLPQRHVSVIIVVYQHKLPQVDQPVETVALCGLMHVHKGQSGGFCEGLSRTQLEFLQLPSILSSSEAPSLLL